MIFSFTQHFFDFNDKTSSKVGKKIFRNIFGVCNYIYNHMTKRELKQLIREVIQENWTNWSLIIDRTGKIHDCGMDHASWMDNYWKPKKMAPGYKINVQSHGDSEQLLYVDERANNGILRKKLVAFAEDNGIKSIVWTNSITHRGRLEQL